jgi:hypothetical protein
MLNAALLLVAEVLQEGGLNEAEGFPDFYGEEPRSPEELKLNIWNGVVFNLLDSGAPFLSDGSQKGGVKCPLCDKPFVSWL